jgi:hypothetical protein
MGGGLARDPTGEKGILVPVRVRICDLEGLLSQIVYIDLVGLNETEAARALRRVKRGRGKPTTQPAFPGAPLHSSSTPPPFLIAIQTMMIMVLGQAHMRQLVVSKEPTRE